MGTDRPAVDEQLREQLESPPAPTQTHTDDDGSVSAVRQIERLCDEDLEESLQHDVDDLVLLVDVVQLHQILQSVQLIFPLRLKQTLI